MGIMGAASVCMLKPKIKATYLQMKSHMNMHITLKPLRDEVNDADHGYSTMF